MRPPAVHTDPTTPYGGVGCTWVVVRAVSAQLNVCVCVSTTVSSSESARGDRPRGARSFGIRAQPDRVSTQTEIFGSVAIVSPPRVPSSPRPENYSAHRPVVPGPFPDPRISSAPPHRYRRFTGFVNERASSKRNHDASLANSYSARAHYSVISEIDTGLRNPRTCNQWVSLMTSAESSELA